MRLIILVLLCFFSSIAQADVGVSASGDISYITNSGIAVNPVTGEISGIAVNPVTGGIGYTVPHRNNAETSSIVDINANSNRRQKGYDSDGYDEDGYDEENDW